MNKARRAQIQKLVADLTALSETAQSIHEAEQEYYDNMPEAFQGSDKGTKVEEDIDRLDITMNGIMEALDALNEIE